MSRRPTAVAGHFYPDNPVQLRHLLDQLLQDMAPSQKRPRLIVVPHAGYIYSGKTAAFAYGSLKGHDYQRVLLVGPSHHVSFMGYAFSDVTHWETPLGEVALDHYGMDQFLKTNPEIPAFLHPQPHEREHSLEVQVPFLQSVLKEGFRLIPVVYGRSEAKDLLKILEAFGDDETLIVISTDLSHFYEQSKANELDKICCDAMVAMDAGGLEQCEACGRIGMQAAALYGRHHGLNTRMLSYRTSGDVVGDMSSVVGYASFLMTDNDTEDE